jgi:hypothetical protein
MNKIINLNGNAIELAKIKAISVNEYYNMKLKTNEIKIELTSRIEYILNPSSEEFELQIIKDVLIVEFPDGDTAISNYMEMMQIWEDSLEKFD